MSVSWLLLFNVIIVIKKVLFISLTANAQTPVISSTRFVAGQQATTKCEGNIGNPPELNQLFIEALVTDGPFMTDGFEQMPPTSNYTEFDNVTCSYMKSVILNTDVMEIMDEVLEFRCRIATNSGDLTSEVISVNVETQGMSV